MWMIFKNIQLKIYNKFNKNYKLVLLIKTWFINKKI